uniref:Uncharacterized protein n=1 Tax=Avena sativa TaxID=4498 RepID=A0ACD6AIR8_AVESA
MEASKFSFGLDTPPALKFDPTDTDIVAHYLLPRALGLPNPYGSAIIEGDPASAPPWEILERCGNVAHAFFFGPPTDPSQNGGRRNRSVGGGGVWQGQKGVEKTVTLLRPGGGEIDIRYKRYHLSFCLAKRGRSTGYVMHEYEILSPPLPGTVLTRIKAPNSVKKHHVPDPEQPGPSHEYDGAAMTGNGDEVLGGAQDGALNGGGMVKNAGNPLQNYLPLDEYGDDDDNNNNKNVSIQDQSGASYHYEAAVMKGEGFTGAQAHEFCGGGMVDTSGAYYDPSGYVPECGGDYSNYYGEYQQWRYQQDTSNQYQAGDDNVMCTGGEQQAGALCGNSDNGSVVGTETSAHSTISLCGEYQQWQYQQDPSSQYQAGDDALKRADGEGFSGEEQPGALCGNSDNGSVMGTETSAHSTILSLCGDGEVESGEYQQWQYQQDTINQYQARNDAVMGSGGEEQAGALCGDSDSGSVVGTETCAHSTISLCGDEEEECDVSTFYKLFFGDDDESPKSEQHGAGDPANELVVI